MTLTTTFPSSQSLALSIYVINVALVEYWEDVGRFASSIVPIPLSASPPITEGAVAKSQ